MRSFLLLCVVPIGVAFAPAELVRASESAGWEAGLARVVITPTDPVWMAGYASRGGPSDGVLLDLYARALVLVDATKHRFVLVTLDITDHPETIALFLVECGGDQDPAPRRNDEDAVQCGLALASAVEAALVPAPVVLSPTLASSLEMCPLAYAPLPPRAELEARASSGNGFVSRHARWILKEWPNPGDHPAEYRLPVQVTVLGQKLLLVALGGEPVVDYSLRLKKELSSDQRLVWVAGYSNLVNAHVPSRRVLLEGGYEGTEAVIYQSLPGPFRDDVEERIIGAVHKQARQLTGASPK